MCPFEVLHFLPLALIAVSSLSKLNKIATSTAILVLSLVGLFAGDHIHTAHGEVLNLVDPCAAYAVAAVYAAFSLAQSLRAKLVNA